MTASFKESTLTRSKSKKLRLSNETKNQYKSFLASKNNSKAQQLLQQIVRADDIPLKKKKKNFNLTLDFGKINLQQRKSMTNTQDQQNSRNLTSNIPNLGLVDNTPQNTEQIKGKNLTYGTIRRVNFNKISTVQVSRNNSPSQILTSYLNLSSKPISMKPRSFYS